MESFGDEIASIVTKRNTIYSRLGATLRKDLQLHLIILAPFIWLIIFAYVPMYGLIIAFKEFFPNLGMINSPWVGFVNFRAFFTSYQFPIVVRNTLSINFYNLLAGFPIPIILALSINNAGNRIFKKTVQMVTYAPYFISTVVMVGLIIQLLSPSVGLYGKLTRLLDIDAPSLLSTPRYFKSVYVWSGIWQNMGWNSIIFIAVLSSVDRELYDAATVDGASRLQRIIHVEMPTVIPTAIILLIINFGYLMTVGFEKIYLMQNDLNLAASEVIQTYVYKVSFQNTIPNFSYATAVGMFNSAVNLLLIVTVNSIAKRTSEISLW